jgi:UDP-N-acetylmuramoyl-tripeptide--D-alanyl-D-alanine ligase
MALTLEFLVKTLCPQGWAAQIGGDHPVREAVIDSRRAGPGTLFVALTGEKTDGHDYVRQAIENGALAALVERDVDVPYPVVDLRPGGGDERQAVPLPTPLVLRVESTLQALQEAARAWMRHLHTRVIGITGSVGKTTTKELVADVLSRRYQTLRSEGNYNNEIGLPVSVLRLTEEHQRAVLEMGFYVPGEIAFLCGIAPPKVGVVTLIAPVHLERAGSMEAIIQGKGELVEALPPDGVAVLNHDDPNVMTMTARTQARVLTFGLTPSADLWADQIEGLGLEGVRFCLHHGEDSFWVRLPLLGRHSVQPALAAAAVGLIEGMDWPSIIEGLETSRSQLRLVAVPGPRGSLILDDTYNASPPATIAALNLLGDLKQERRIAVLGDMLELGSYEEEGHRQVGRQAAAIVDLLVTVGGRGKIIAREALGAGMPSSAVKALDTAEEAAAFLLGELREGDAALIKGSRAVHMERIVSLLGEETDNGQG